jgi:hypothetical protein
MIPSGENELFLGIFSCETCDSVSFSTPGAELWNQSAGGGREIGTGVIYESSGRDAW